MKKFNSILAIATVALTSVFGFTSCDKNDDPIMAPVETKMQTPEILEDAYLYMPATNEQVKYMDITCVCSVDGQKVEVKMSEMTVVDDAERLSNSKELLDLYEAFSEDDQKDGTTMFECNLGKVRDVRILSVYCTPSTDVLDHEIDYIVAPAVKRGMATICKGKTTDQVFRGVHTLKEHLDVFNKYNK